MENLTDPTKLAESVAKIGDSQLVNKAYDDLAANPMREGGKAMTDLVKAFRLFLAPIQLLAVAQDRLAAFCDRVRAKVPEDRQREAAPSIALPILMDLRFMEDGNLLTELYLNLLARAIDKERCNEAHPAFVKIIEQMSPDEAMVMYQFRDRESWFMRYPKSKGVIQSRFPVQSLANPAEFLACIEHLEALNLLKLPGSKVEVQDNRASFCGKRIGTGTQNVVERQDSEIKVTSFGKRFVAACIPENFDVAKFRGDQPDTTD